MSRLRKSWILSLLMLLPWTTLTAYTVKPGDSLWKIAARPQVFGDPWKWPLLLDANPRRIADPDLIKAGWELKVPANPSPAQILSALEFARHYKEPVAGPPLTDSLPPAQTKAVTPAKGPGSFLVFLYMGLLAFAGLAVGVYFAATRLLQAEQRRDVPAEQPVPEPPLEPQPTESEAILRAMDGPDPLKHEHEAEETHREAA